jgi:uncharacterized protein YprB with RNaseH-like and TPR domain
VAKKIWKKSPKHTLPKDKKELQKELDIIREVQSNLRKAVSIETEVFDNGLMDIYQKIIDEKNRPKRRLFFDIETSPNVVFSWRIGYKINLSHDNIINERAVICVCWKWEGEEKVHSLQWDKGCDKDLLSKFSKIIDSADEVIGQNSDKFDIKWLRTRAIYHNIPISPKFNSIDTLKMARTGFNFNSNKLDYMGKFLGVGGKNQTGYDLWKDIILSNSKQAMLTMIEYCKVDVIRLEGVYHKLQPYCPIKKFKYKL